MTWLNPQGVSAEAGGDFQFAERSISGSVENVNLVREIFRDDRDPAVVRNWRPVEEKMTVLGHIIYSPVRRWRLNHFSKIALNPSFCATHRPMTTGFKSQGVIKSGDRS